jgi:hypothetical protein
MSRTAALSVFLVLALPAAVPRPALAPPVAVTCTFVNPAYAGDCVEKTTREEKEKPAAACAPILNCLNNPNCAKTYCRSTTVRQGWTLKSATEEKK